MQKCANLAELDKCCTICLLFLKKCYTMNMYPQKSASIQPTTSPSNLVKLGKFMKIENSEKMPSRSNTAESPNACGSALREAGRRIRSARARSSRRRCACCSPDPLEFPLAARRSTRQKTPTSDCLKNALSATRLVHSFGLILFLKNAS